MPESLGRSPRLLSWIVAAFLVFFLLVPFAGTAWKSLLQLDPAHPESYGRFIGLANYKTILTQEPEFRTSLLASLSFMALTLLQCLLAFLLSLLFRSLWPNRLPITLVLLLTFPQLVSPTIVALMGRLYLNDQYGAITHLLRSLHAIGINDAPLGSSTGVWFWLALLDAWQWLPFTILLFWLCLRLIPPKQLEAARLDGLGRMMLIRFVVLPKLIVPVTIVVLFRLMEALRSYDLPQTLTGGGPGISTLMTSIYATRITFTQQRFGIGAAHLVLLEVFAYLFILVLASEVKSLRGVIRKGVG
jgi:multiple sugar transport system permease protein